MVAKTSLETIVELLLELKPVLIKAGIPEKQLRIRRGKHRVPACNRAFDWLHDIKLGTEYQEYKKVRALLPETTWDRYILFEIEGLREQKLHEQAAQKLRARWRRKRPAMFNSDLKKKVKTNG